MLSEIKIDKSRNTPAYRQLVEGLTVLIQTGKLKPGQKLPSERELQDQLGISRGTIKKAIQKLGNNNIVESIAGSGTFVSYKQDSITISRKELAVTKIDTLLTELTELNFSYREISNLAELLMMERQERLDNFYISVIDCNPELLDVFQKQVKHVGPLRLSKMLLSDLRNSPDPQAKLESYRLIVTTSTHFSELIGMLPDLKDRIMQAVISPSQESVISLAKIGIGQKVGIISQSRNFQRMIADKLRDFQVASGDIDSINLGDLNCETLQAFLADKQVVILPPGCSITPDRQSLAVVQNFISLGGQVVFFTFQVERGSLLHIEERIKSLLQR